jgi:uncharacterized membrane protein
MAGMFSSVLRPAPLAALFAATVSALKAGQHFSLQTQAYDLGIYANVLWNTGQGRFFENSISRVSYLGDHFAPLLLLLVPLLRLWENAAALLLFQSAALALAVPAVYGLARRAAGEKSAAGFAVWFALFPYLHMVSRYDFHEAALGIPLVLGALCFLEADRPKAFWACAAPLLFLREDFALYAGITGVYIALLSERRRLPAWRISGAALAIAGFGLFFLYVLVLIPRFGQAWRPAAFSYANLGSTFPEILASLASPAKVWENTLGHPEKVRSLATLALFSGGLWLAAPRQCFLLAAPLLINSLSGNPGQYKFEAHYSAAVIPFLFYAMIHGYRNIARRAGRRRGAGGGFARRALFAAAAALCVLHLPRYFHRVPAERVRAAREAARMIPAGDAVMAQNNLLPHVCFRREISLIPADRPVRWAFFDLDRTGFHPPPAFTAFAADFMARNQDRLVFDQGGLRLYRAADAP